ncbi:NAD(P)/FAD-dependent oxidoreductase [Hirschia litorea]|uniref:NAD(P)/FAD-dependent oxidoreductase n=1 Tax=Hirschia litorea TaxID=1199156 RepID=A0ABW2IKC4_9PROT
MAPIISPVLTTKDIPDESHVVIIGGGIIGLVAALNLAERGVPVVVLEKGRIAAEQSSRNLGWIRKLNRSAHDMPLALAAERIWADLSQRTGMDVGYRTPGLMFAARSEIELDKYRGWLQSVEGLSLGAKLVTQDDINEIVPGGTITWAGGIHMPTDGYAEPTLASTAIATAALRAGALIVENCAARTLNLNSQNEVLSVVTERGLIHCNQVLLSGGIWSRRFLKNLNISLPTLPMVGSVIRTAPMEGPSDIAFGASNFSFRKCLDGGYILMQRGALDAPMTPDHIALGMKYIPALKANAEFVRPNIGRYFFEELFRGFARSGKKVSPFERERIQNPQVNRDLVKEALNAATEAWPAFADVKVCSTWAGVIDITPDSDPIISKVDDVPGLTLATGFSGHGFGTSPAAGQLAADLIMGTNPIVDNASYRFDRF